MLRSPAARVSLLFLVALTAAAIFADEAVRLKPMLSIYIDAEGNGIQGPQGIGCDGGSIVVADTMNGRILIYDVGIESIEPRGEVSSPQLAFPLRVSFLSNGDILVLDGRSRRIGRVTKEGELRGFLEPGDDDGESFTPRSFAVGPDDRVFVLDVGGSRLLVFDPSGTVERSIAFPPEAGFLSDLAVDSRGDVYAIDSVERRVHVARRNDEALSPLTPPLLEDVDFPTSIAVDEEGRLFVVDEYGGGVVILGRDGSYRGRQLRMGWKEGYVRYPADICLDGRGALFLADRGNSRVQMFSVR